MRQNQSPKFDISRKANRMKRKIAFESKGCISVKNNRSEIECTVLYIAVTFL